VRTFRATINIWVAEATVRGIFKLGHYLAAHRYLFMPFGFSSDGGTYAKLGLPGEGEERILEERLGNSIVQQKPDHIRRKDRGFHIDDERNNVHFVVAFELDPEFVEAGLGEDCGEGDVGAGAGVWGGGY
jgi:hypothetical protein